jgi:hypothetical protein
MATVAFAGFLPLCREKPYDRRLMRAATILLFILSCAFFSGCVGTITPQEQAAATAVDPLSSEQARAIVLSYIHDTFKDPDSIKDLKIVQPELQKTLTGEYRWSILFSVNAKNSFGAYTGPIPYQLLCSHGRILLGLQIISIPEGPFI